MAQTLPRLRMDLEFMPSPSPEHPGLLIRDAMHFSDAVLVVPHGIVELLGYFDGQTSVSDLKAELVRMTNDVSAGLVIDDLLKLFDDAGFLENERSLELAAAKQKAFADSPVRPPAHAGSGYPDHQDELRQVLGDYMKEPQSIHPASPIRAIAAPHVSPFGGWRCYRDAYAALRTSVGDRGQDATFIILGTSHYGPPDIFGLTRKPFETPYGTTRTAGALIDELAHLAPNAIAMEDYCHSLEHSIEFQVVFLQHLFGPNIKILPILCGAFARSVMEGTGLPEDNPEVARFIDTLGNIGARDSKDLYWVMGVDMAHMGRRYGDPFNATPAQGEMLDTAIRDKDRLAQMEKNDAHGFWRRIQERHDDLKWCGSSPIYTFLKACPDQRGQTIEYEQWQIDEASVVTFAAVQFAQTSPPPSIRRGS